MALLNEKGFERKLQQMSLAQDSVQTVSLWIIHHKKYAGDIVKVWTENLKKCSPDRRLVLFYLANDVLQNSRKKGKEFSTAFSKVLKDVIPLLSERKICDSVQRVMKIWHERKVFDKEFLDSLQRKFEASQGKPTKVHGVHKLKTSHTTDSDGEHGTPKQEIKHSTSTQKTQEKKLPPADFKPSQMIDSLKAMRDLQAEVTLKESQLNSLRIDASDMEAIKQLKDRATGAKFTAEYEAASEKLESFCGTLKMQKEEILKMIQCVEDGKLFYDSAFGEVKVIVHAYKTFGNRLNSLKKKVDNKVAKIINAEAEKKKMGPIHTPQASFLTSGLPEIAVDTEEKSSEAVDPTVDNTEVADMDIEDDGDSENDESSQSPTDSTATPLSDVKTTETSASATSVETTPTTTATQATSTSSCASSSITTTFSGSTSVASMPVQMTAVHPQMMMQQPMQFIHGQPGMSMIPVGMPGSGQFISIPSQYPQPMVPYGMGMHAIGSFPSQPQLTRLPLPGQAPFPGAVPNLPQQIPGNVPASQMAVGNNTLTPVINPSSLPTHSVTPSSSTSAVPLPQPAPTTSTNSVTSPTQSVSKPLPSSNAANIESTPRKTIGSPGSEMSAPSPVGSPELELGGDETPETASPQRVDEVKIIGFPAMSGQQSDQGELPGTSEEASAPSTGSASPNRAGELSKPVSAVNILAQLISRGRQLKEQTPEMESTSGASTPKEEPPATTQPQQEKPLFSLIDSLFPKLTDSLKTIREREKDNETSTSTSEEGSPKQKIEINSMGDNDDSENEGDLMMRPQQHAPEEHRGPVGFHPADFSLGNPRVPFAGHPHDGPLRQPWNEEHFPSHRPPFREYQERPQIPPPSPIKGPGLSPRFPGPRPFPGSQGTFFIPPETESVGEPRDEFRGMPQRSPRQLHSPRAQFNMPIEHERELNDGPLNNRPQIRPISPRGGFPGVEQNHGPHDRPPHFEGIPREEQRPHFHFENPGAPPRPVGPPDIHRMPLGGSPQRAHIDGQPKPRWLSQEGPRGNPPQHDGPRVFHRSFSDGEMGEIPGEPPMKRPMLEEGPPRSFSDQGRPIRPGFHPPSPGFERNREMWNEREQWEPRHAVPDRTRPEFRNREHLSPRFIEHGNRSFPPHQERPPFRPRRNSFKGFEHREHFPEHRPRPRFPFRGGHPRPFY